MCNTIMYYLPIDTITRGIGVAKFDRQKKKDRASDEYCFLFHVQLVHELQMYQFW